MSTRLAAVMLAARDPDRLADFWSTLLARPVRPHADGPLLPATDTQVGLQFVPDPTPRPGPDRVHVHLTSDADADQAATVRAAQQLGAVPVDVGQRPEERHLVLADPEGNPFCVIEAGNSYLAGCGFLGEIACDGTRDVGLFWAAVLGWPLVWDRDEETAIQAPAGGTKVAWGGPPLEPRLGPDRQRFRLVCGADERSGEMERLVGLGATVTDDTDVDRVVLADPDGTEFWLTPT